MSVEVQRALEVVDEAALQIFSEDSATRSVGIGLVRGSPSIIVVRNVSQAARFEPLAHFGNFPVSYLECDHDPLLLHTTSAGPVVPERQRHRPLKCGLEVQNLDQDLRDGLTEGEEPNRGSIGCFVRFADGSPGLISNNHVIAGENSAIIGKDRIVQPGTDRDNNPEVVATLRKFEPLVKSHPSKKFGPNGHAPNVVDAASATIDPHQRALQQYLHGRVGAPPTKLGSAKLQLRVHKVGRGNGETFGVIKQIGVVVGPLPYKIGDCWFRRTIIIESADATTFSRGGDSGAAIVDDEGSAVGLIFGGIPGTTRGFPHQTYACPMDAILTKLDCSLL